MDNLIKIECGTKTATTIVENLIDEHCVIEGTAILTTHSFNELTADLATSIATIGEVNEADLQEWARYQ